MKRASAKTLSKPDNIQDIMDLVEMMKHNNDLSWRTSSVYIEPIKDAFRLSFFRDKAKIVGKIQKLEQLLKKMDTLKTKQQKDKTKFNKQIWDRHETSPRTYFSRVEKEINKVVSDIDSALKTAVNKTSYNHNRMRKPVPEKIKTKIPKPVWDIFKKFTDEGYEIYLVGAAVRNLLSEKEPIDCDFTTNAKPQIITSFFIIVIDI